MNTPQTLLRIYETLLEFFGPQGWWPGQTKTEIAVGAILAQNTNWKNVEKAIANLKARGLLDVRALRDLPPEELAELIRPSGYFRIKAKRLKKFVEWVCREYDGDVDRMLEADLYDLRAGLLSVSGIGPETADSILLYAGERPVFVVDTYTYRVFVRHAMVPEDANYEELREFFESNLPEDVALYNEYHALLVALGKNYCRPRPLCDKCPLAKLLGRPTAGLGEDS